LLISVIHIEYNARQEIFDYLGIEVKDLEKLTYHILKKHNQSSPCIFKKESTVAVWL
jgi:hypothetical protein